MNVPIKIMCFLAIHSILDLPAQNTKDSIISREVAEVVVTGTLKPTYKDKSPVPVGVYGQSFLKRSASSNILESVSMINGIRSQVNCSVCNTADIHINGLEGPYTMVLIDGMPIVSALSSVYGFSGIPNSIIERIEVVRGPASSLYGSEAMAGTINIITKNALTAPVFSSDFSTTTWWEKNFDVATKFNLGDRASSLISVNYFDFDNRVDKNKDGFMDVALQRRISAFNKWNFKRDENRVASAAFRYLYEDRLGGQMDWKKEDRGGDKVYGESIYTNRFEFIGAYQLPTEEKIFSSFSFNHHDQNSFYGKKSYMATQQVGFGQMYWNKTLNEHDLILGGSLRYDYYDDNTPGTALENGENAPMNTITPGIFVQDQWNINEKNDLLLGYRVDHHDTHGFIHSPRLAYKLNPFPLTNIRASFGTGFRVVNLFTEDHAALTGSREVVITEKLQPEKSINGGLNVTQKVLTGGGYINFDVSGFYSHFSNKIIGDFDENDTQIIYQNLRGYAVSRGASFNTSVKFASLPLLIDFGATYTDVFHKYEEDGVTEKEQQVLSPRWSGTYMIEYTFPGQFSVDLTGQVYGPMRLVTVSNDFRPDRSRWYTLANVQLRKVFQGSGVEIYGGVKNIFNFKPKNPISRPHDPFGQNNENDPNDLPFGTEYGYAPMQGIRGFLGLRLLIR